MLNLEAWTTGVKYRLVSDFVVVTIFLENTQSYHIHSLLTGQLYQIAEEVYNTQLSIKVLEETTSVPGARKVQVKFRLDFDNREFVLSRTDKRTHLERLTLPAVPCSVLMRLFPFGLVFNEHMCILAAGEKLLQVCGTSPHALLGQSVTDNFKLRRPRGIPFTWKNVRLCFILLYFLSLDVNCILKFV
jgi:guanylate cyclase